MRPGEKLSHAIQKRVVQEALFVVRDLDWDTLTATVEFKEAPGLMARARIATVSGSGGTLYPPLMAGDVVKGEIHGADLSEMMETKEPRQPSNPYLYDRTDVTIGLSVHADNGEPPARRSAIPHADGQWLLVHASGGRFRMDADGNVHVEPGPGGAIYLGSMVNPLPALRHGDVDPGGGVQASQAKVYIGE